MEFFHDGRVGTMTVTGRMMADTGTSSVDTDGFVDYPRAVSGVELAILFREDGHRTCKVSLRSVGQADAASLAENFGGGGHYRAAGFTRLGSIDQVKKETIQAVEKILPCPVNGTNP
jgi:phosphoesterase RecJ-like protein